MRNDLKAAVDELEALKTHYDIQGPGAEEGTECHLICSSIDTALDALRDALKRQPDPITGLVPCGCGGEVYPHYQLGWCHESGVQAFEVSTGCDGCGTYTKPRRGRYVNGIDKDDTELASKRDWNTSHGYTDPPLPEVKG